jgi:hypothetical protein
MVDFNRDGEVNDVEPTELPEFGDWIRTEEYMGGIDDEVYTTGITYQQVPPASTNIGLWYSHTHGYVLRLFKALYRDGNGDTVDPITEDYLVTTYHRLDGPNRHNNLKNMVNAPLYWASIRFQELGEDDHE